jgi:hypothetical protein
VNYGVLPHQRIFRTVCWHKSTIEKSGCVFLVTPHVTGIAAVYLHEMKKFILTLLSPSATARAVRQFTPVFACCSALGFFAGCASEPDSPMVSAPPPPAPTSTVITTTTTTPVVVAAPAAVDGNTAYATAPAAVSTIVVTQAPPAPEQEAALAQPSPQHVWLAGYWTWHHDQYQWMAGHWELPPNSNSVWVAPRWEQQGNAYRFYEGYWN